MGTDAGVLTTWDESEEISILVVGDRLVSLEKIKTGLFVYLDEKGQTDSFITPLEIQ